MLLTFQEESTTLIIAETKPMASRQVEVNAEELKSSIDTAGGALVYGIYFDTAKTALKPESEPTLKQIAQLLSQNRALKLYVVGHTDDVGALASVASNRSEAGRAKNRRVELVEATASGAVRVSAAAEK